jgi:hypothetical protein
MIKISCGKHHAMEVQRAVEIKRNIKVKKIQERNVQELELQVMHVLLDSRSCRFIPCILWIGGFVFYSRSECCTPVCAVGSQSNDCVICRYLKCMSTTENTTKAGKPGSIPRQLKVEFFSSQLCPGWLWGRLRLLSNGKRGL